MKKNYDDGLDYYQQITPEGLVDNVKDPEPEIAENRYKRFRFEGRVLQFRRCVIPSFNEETEAVSERKAIANLKYRAKQRLGLAPHAGGIELRGSIREV